jgi:uncharacterized protein (DUF1697 family)
MADRKADRTANPTADPTADPTAEPPADRLIALLRGINVGGNKLIDMGRLRGLLADAGYTDVRTYLQSGNAVFSATDTASEAAGDIEVAIAKEFGFNCRVIVRTAAQLAAVIAADPLLDLLGNPSRHFVAFLDASPRPDGVKMLTEDDYGPDQLQIVNGHVYLWCPNGISKSRFAKLNFDRILGTAVTLRNWNTITKLAELAGSR